MSISSRNQRRGGCEEKGKTGKFDDRALSFQGGDLTTQDRSLPRPKTELQPRLTKLLLNVTVQKSLGAVQVVMSPECRVTDLVAAAVKQYGKEGRRPFLVTNNPAEFDLHYSQFSLESLDREEKLQTLGSRNFFLCPTRKSVNIAADTTVTNTSTLCSDQVGRTSKIAANPLSRLMDFLM